MTPKLSNTNIRIDGNIKNESCLTTWVEPKTIVQPCPNHKNGPLIKSKSNVRIERNIENESCLTTWVDPKTVVEQYPKPKSSPLEPPKNKSGPKKSQNQMSELKKT